jgi:predicted signal transduction protein with EAL and GGDEF domain
MIAMAHDLGMDAVAEGIETVEQLDELKKVGCNYGQGYLMSQPVNPAGIEKLLLDPSLPTARLLPAALPAAQRPFENCPPPRGDCHFQSDSHLA